MVTSMSPFSPQPLTPQKRHLENSLEKADSVIRSGGLSKKSFYGNCKRTKLFQRISKLDPNSWVSDSREERKKDVYDFDENGETPFESPFTRVVKPHEIGFPNPPGTNICWMNATLQIILGMRPLIDELESPCGSSVSRNHFSPILQSFLDLMRQYKRGRLLPVHKNLGNLKNALATLDAGFAGEHQQDAPEVLIRLLDTFREDFYEISKADKNIQENGALREIKLENNISQSPVPSRSDNGLRANPVCENLQFSMREHYCCTNCGVRSDRSQEHLTLYVDIPVEGPVVSVDSALEQYMKTHTREMRCEKCSGGSCRVNTVFSQLPRILLILVKRYTCRGNFTQKITNSIMIPSELNLRSAVDTDVVMPKPRNTEKREKENYIETPKTSAIRRGDEDSYDEETDDEDDVNKFFYKLTGILSHHGDNPNAGHYVADVYHYAPNSWYHYDDESVEQVKESDVLGNSREQSGYMFVYTYRPLYEDLKLQGSATKV